MMRKRIVTAVAVAVLGLGTLGMASASAGNGEGNGEPNISQFCKEFFEPALEQVLQADISHGACVALLTTENPVPLISSLCKSPAAIAIIEEQENVDVPAKHGQCVKFLKRLAQENGGNGT